MSFSEFEHQAMRTAKQGGFEFDLTHAALGLSGEVGEFVDCVKKHTIYDQDLNHENAVEELGDILWFVALACQTLGVSMADAATKCVEKLKVRYPDKYTDSHAERRVDKDE
jgi:NTP pyrophosphatase (non-canonical NTP hydrolase)